MITSVA